MNPSIILTTESEEGLRHEQTGTVCQKASLWCKILNWPLRYPATGVHTIEGSPPFECKCDL